MSMIRLGTRKEAIGHGNGAAWAGKTSAQTEGRQTAKPGLTAHPGDQHTFEGEALPDLDALYRFALHLSGVPEQAEDLVQETVLKAWRAWGEFQLGTNARAWLMTILRHGLSHIGNTDLH